MDALEICQIFALIVIRIRYSFFTALDVLHHFYTKIFQEAEVNAFIAQVAEEVHNRMDRIKVKGKTITLKLKIRAKDAPVETAKFLGEYIRWFVVIFNS